MHADEFGEADFFGEFPFVIDRRKHGEPVLLAGHVVVRAVAGGDVDRAGAGVGGDEIREDELRRAVEERMPGLEAFEFLALAFPDRFREREAGFFGERTDEFADDHEGFDHVVLDEFSDDVGEVRMQRDAEVGRERPRRGGPDDHAGLARELAGDERELDENRRAFLVLVFDFGLGERGLRAVGPLDRLLRLVDHAVFHQLREDAQDARLVAGIHRQIRAVPIAEHPEPAERTALDVDEFQGELACSGGGFPQAPDRRLP